MLRQCPGACGGKGGNGKGKLSLMDILTTNRMSTRLFTHWQGRAKGRIGQKTGRKGKGDRKGKKGNNKNENTHGRREMVGWG